MIRVCVHKESSGYRQIEVSGHAMSQDPGFDLVCAGVSSIATGALNGFYELDADCELIMNDEPYIKIRCNSINKINQTLMQFLLIQLKTVEAVHGEYIRIEVKEDTL